MPGPRVLLVGGPDVDARLDVMRSLAGRFEVSAAGTDPAVAPRFAAAGFPFHPYPMRRGASPLADLRTYRALVRLCRAERPDVVHAFDTKPTVWARLAARRAGVAVVAGTVPGLGSLYASTGLRARLTRAIYQPLQARACRRSDVTVFQNEDDRREFIARRVVPEDRTALIAGSGVRTDLFRPDVPSERRAALRRAIGAAPDSVVVTMVSRVTATKGVLEFAAAARESARHSAANGGPELRFVLVGPEDGAAGDRLSRADLDGLRSAVTWLGRREDVKDLLAASDVFAFPSYYREGFPRALVEAASMGLPLIAADVPGSREIVRHGENGFLVPPHDTPALADAVDRLARDQALRRRFGAASRERAESQFDVGRIADLTAALYSTLMARRVAATGGGG